MVAILGKAVEAVYYFLWVPILLIVGLILYNAFDKSLLLGSALAVFAGGVVALWIYQKD